MAYVERQRGQQHLVPMTERHEHRGWCAVAGLDEILPGRARKWLEDHGVDDVQLVSTGGYRTPDEMTKALALGADAIALATAALMAIGCLEYML